MRDRMFPRRGVGVDVAKDAFTALVEVLCHRLCLQLRSGKGSASRRSDGLPQAPPLLGQLDPYAQQLGHTPRLRDAAARCVGLVAVENFADRSDAGVVEMFNEAVERVRQRPE